MWSNTVIRVLIGVLHWPVNILAILTTFVGGIIMALPIVGLLFILLLTIIWLPILGLLLGSAWLWHHAPSFLRPLIAIVGIVTAVVGNVFVSLSPGGGDPDDMVAKFQKQVLCQFWPYAHTNALGATLISGLRVEENLSFVSAVFRMTNVIAERDNPYAR